MLKEKLDEVKPNSEVSLSGGEPALLAKESLDYAIKILKQKECEITVNTNGLFFTKCAEYIPDIDYFYYHCTEDLDTSKGINLTNVPFEKTEFMMVLTDDNHKNLEWFLDEYPEIEFKVTSADQTTVRGKAGTKLSKLNAIKVWHKFKDRISPDSMMFLLERCKLVNGDLERK